MHTRPTPEEMLFNLFNGSMMDSAEVVPATHFAAEVVDIELRFGVEFTRLELQAAWYDAADQMVDSYISNEHDTPQSDEQREQAIARWEAMRPRTIRTKKVQQLLNW